MTELREVFEMVTKHTEPDLDSWKDQEDRQRRSARIRKLGALAVAAAIGAAAVALILGTRPEENPTIPVVEPPVVAPGSPFFLDLRTGEKTPLAENLAGGYAYVASPDGTRLAYNTEDVLTVASIDGTDARSLQVPEGLSGYGPRWSPDGTKLVYQQNKGAVDPGDVGNLFVEDLSSGRRTQLTHLELGSANWWFLSPSFSPDGRNVIFDMARSSFDSKTRDVWSVPVSGGESTLVLRNASFPMYFPDGSEIAFVSPLPSPALGGSSISIADAQGTRRTLVEANIEIWAPQMSPDGSRIAYQDGGSIYVVEVSTGKSSKVADGNTAEWLDDDSLIVAP